MKDLELAVVRASGAAGRLADADDVAAQRLEHAREEAALVLAAARVAARVAGRAGVETDPLPALVALKDARVGAVLADAVDARVERVGRLAPEPAPRDERIARRQARRGARRRGRRGPDAGKGRAGVRDGRKVAHDGAAEEEGEEEEPEDDQAASHQEDAAARARGRRDAMEKVHERAEDGAGDGSISYDQGNTGRDVRLKGGKAIGTAHEEAGSGLASGAGPATGGERVTGSGEASGSGGSVSRARRT